MSRSLQIELSESAYSRLAIQAAAQGIEPAVLATRAVEIQFCAGPTTNMERQTIAGERFERHFGTWDVGHPIGADNEQIDRDLALEYARGLDNV